MNHGLTSTHLAILRAILAPFMEHITTIGLFGSRATGKYRPNSDIDLVLYGTLTQAMVDRIHSLCAESHLPYTVDVHAYHLISYPPLKAHIDAVMKPLSF
jgi:predicted nucleotidyltransferase